MRIIISPSKKMNVDTDTLPCQSMPLFLPKTKRLMNYFKTLSYEQCKAIWKCNDKIARLNFERFRKMDLERDLTPAILSYEGLQYQYMAPGVMEEESLAYLQEHLRILSGFYGMLKPFDAIVPYRLEMQSRLGSPHMDSLYEFWFKQNKESESMIYEKGSYILPSRKRSLICRKIGTRRGYGSGCLKRAFPLSYF